MNLFMYAMMKTGRSGITPTGKVVFTENQTDADISGYATADIAVPVPPEYVIPQGKVTITENQTGLDISGYAEADVAVEAAPVGWLLDTYVDGCPTRARFYPSETLTDAGNYVFNRHSYDRNSVIAKLTDIEFMPGTSDTGDYIVYNCTSVQNITIPEGVTVIGSNDFEYTAITSLIIPSTVTSYGDYFCRNCSELEYIEFKGDCVLHYYLFSGTALKQCICRGNVTSITSASFPSTMELYDFSNCTAVPTLNAVSAIGYGAGTVIRIPSALYDEWISATNWCDIPTDTSESAYVIFEGV